MEALTKKQRREIYLRVAQRVYELSQFDGMSIFLCGKLGQYMERSSLYKVGTGLPEFDLFQPTEEEKRVELTHDCELWWNDVPHKRACNVRITCMLLCAEMCND